MSNEVTVHDKSGVEREARLTRLAEVANEAHDNMVTAARRAVAHALEAGKALLEAKDLCTKGTWTVWLTERFSGDASTARGYMRLATYLPQVKSDRESIRDLNYTEALRLVKGFKRVDGRANNGGRGSAKKAAALANLPEAETNQPLESALPKAVAVVSPALGGDGFALIGQFLQQAIAELKRLAEANKSDAPYARHLLRPLVRIHDGLATRAWVWDD
jgi:hypothetical protein